MIWRVENDGLAECQSGSDLDVGSVTAGQQHDQHIGLANAREFLQRDFAVSISGRLILSSPDKCAFPTPGFERFQ